MKIFRNQKKPEIIK